MTTLTGSGFTISTLDARWQVEAATSSDSDWGALLDDLNRSAQGRARTVLRQAFGDDLSVLEPTDIPTSATVAPGIATNLITVDEVDEVLRSTDATPARLLAHHNLETAAPVGLLAAQPAEFTPGPVNRNSLVHSLRSGWTFTLLSLDQVLPTLSDLALSIELAIGCQVAITAFLSAGSSAAIPLPRDAPDLLVMPVLGSSTWELRRSSALAATAGMRSRPNDADLAFSGTLEPGDVLTVPRSLIHRAGLCGEPSVCIAVGLHRPFGASAVVERMNRAVTVAPMRTAISLSGAMSSRALTAALAPISALATELLRAGQLSEALALQRAKIPSRARGLVLWRLASAASAAERLRGHSFRGRTPGGCHVAHLIEPDGRRSPSIAVANRVLTLSPDLRKIALRALSGELLTDTDISTADDQELALLEALVTAGLVEVVDPTARTLEDLLSGGSSDRPNVPAT